MPDLTVRELTSLLNKKDKLAKQKQQQVTMLVNKIIELLYLQRLGRAATFVYKDKTYQINDLFDVSHTILAEIRRDLEKKDVVRTEDLIYDLLNKKIS
jgi:beta-N-acetylglucosaminidase